MAEKIDSASSNTKDGPRKCEDCKITFPNIYDYASHLESKEHKKGVMKNKYGAKYLEVKANLLAQNFDKQLEEENDQSESSDDEDDVYPCEICKKVCTGALNFRLHLSGKTHKKNVKKNKLLKQMKMEKFIPDGNNSVEDDSLMNVVFTKNEFGSSEFFCKVCNKKCPGPEAFKQHNESVGHKKHLNVQKLLKDMPLKTTAGSSDSDESASLSCDICSKSFSGPLPYQQHMQSSSHLKQKQDVERMEKFKDLIISSEDGKKPRCKECNKVFSGPKPFKDHLKSSLHSKLKKKNELLKIIQEKYPEIIIGSNLDTDDVDYDDDDMLLCSICHTAFTGPESALDHAASQKHEKAMKKKIRLEQLKILKSGKQSHVISKSKSDSNKILNEADHANNSSDDFYIVGKSTVYN